MKKDYVSEHRPWKDNEESKVTLPLGKYNPPFMRNPYNYDKEQASDESGLDCSGDPGRTQQHLAEETDINVIVKRYTQTGMLPQHTLPPMQGDFTKAMTLQDALELIVEARTSFMQQPAEVRARFHNDPGEFVDFCSDESNRDEMRKLGLFSPEAAKRFAQEHADRQLLQEEGKAARAAKTAQKGPDGPKGGT